MKEVTAVRDTTIGSRAERLAAQRAFLTKRGKLYECVSLKVFRYIDNAKWKAQIEAGRP